MKAIEKLQIHHFGYATKSIEDSVIFYKKMNYVSSEIYIDKIQSVKIVLLSKENSITIELVEPLGEKSPVNDILKKNGTTPYHVCYEVDDINNVIKEFKELNFIKLFNPVPAIAFQERLICYLYNRDFGLIELLNKS